MGGWQRQAAAIRGFKTTYLAPFLSDTIVRGATCVITEQDVCRLHFQIWHAHDMKGSQRSDKPPS